MSFADHDLGSPDCWCEPELHRVCPECDPEPSGEVRETRQGAVALISEAADPNCWRCGGRGTIGEPDRWEADHLPLLVIHNEGAQPNG